MLVRRSLPGYKPRRSSSTTSGSSRAARRDADRDATPRRCRPRRWSRCASTAAGRGRVIQTAADGNGPVNALDAAVRKALAEFYPAIDDSGWSTTRCALSTRPAAPAPPSAC